MTAQTNAATAGDNLPGRPATDPYWALIHQQPAAIREAA